MRSKNNYRLSQRYAKAFFNKAVDDKKLESVYEDFQKIKTLLNESSVFVDFIHSPIIPQEKRFSILEKTFDKKIHSLSLDMLHLLVKKDRLNILKDVITAFERLYQKEENILKVQVWTSSKLESHHVSLLKKHLERKFDCEVEPEFYIDRTLLGGLRVKAGDTIYDSSLRSQLEHFKKTVLAN